MIILGIESSCDETAAALVEDGRKVLSSVVASQIDEHKIYGGVVPEIASRRHSEAITAVTEQALAQAGMALADVDAIAVTYAPGLIGALLVGVNFAKGLALASGLPLVPVHHLRGHIAANYLCHPLLEPPFLCLVVSGGHSHIVEVAGYTRLRVLARTRDDAAGEAFDKAARAMGIPYPGGVELDRLAETGDANAYQLPKPRVDGSPLDFSFSGLKTAALNLLHNAAQRGEAVSVPDLCASYRKAVVGCLTGSFRQAVEATGAKTLVAAGGVSANRLLRRELAALSKETGLPLFMPELDLCGDNAAMIAAQGYYEFLAGHTAGMELNAYAQRDIGADGGIIIDPKGIWYHGSDRVFEELREGSTVTQWRDLAEAFSHKPTTLGIEDDGRIWHNGQQPGQLYVIDEPVELGRDVVPHPRTTMEPNAEFLTTRPLRVRLVGQCGKGETCGTAGRTPAAHENP